MKLNKTFFIFLLLIMLVATPVLGAKVVNTGSLGLDIKSPLFDEAHFNDENISFDFHVYNKAGGNPINSGIVCAFHLYDHTGSHIYTDNHIDETYIDHIYDYEVHISGGNFSESGYYTYLFQCNGTVTEYVVTDAGAENTFQATRGGFVESDFAVTPFGNTLTPYSGLIFVSLSMGMCLALIATMFLFAYLYSRTDPINRFLKLLYLGASLLTGITSISFQTNLIDSLVGVANISMVSGVGSTLNLTIWVFRIVMTTIVIWLIWASANAALGNKKRGMESEL